MKIEIEQEAFDAMVTCLKRLLLSEKYGNSPFAKAIADALTKAGQL